MPSTRFGTDHERYIGSGIVALSQLPKASNDDLIIHAKELHQLERRFRPGTCKPWQKESHLKAEISRRHWEKRCIGRSHRLDGHDFPELQFREISDIRIVESMALLQVVRSSKASHWEPWISNHERRWVVDFFRKDGSDSREWASESSHEALSSFFSAPTPDPEAPHSSNNLLQRHVHRSAHIVSGTSGVVEAFQALSRLPSMWMTKSFNFLTDVRKCFCDEEVQNYLWAIFRQWEEITLQWNDRVVPCINIKSIESLQSLAPRFSKHDRDRVERLFQQNSIFPELRDATLRKQVEMAIHDQGPILTLSTFAKDVRLLQSRVREPMTKLLVGMDREQRDTLRKRIVEILEHEFEELSHSTCLPSAFLRQKKAVVERCYQHAFLHTIRNAPPKGSVTQVQLRGLVKQELDSIYPDGTSCSLIVSAEAIATKPPALLDMPEPKHVGVSKRHGVPLFNDPAAVQHLYSHKIRENLTPEGLLSAPFMAQYIVHIFLLGETVFEKVQVAPSSLSEQTIQPTRRTEDELPFWTRTPVDTCAFDDATDFTDFTDFTSVPSFSQTVHWPTPKDMRARRLYPPIERTATDLANSPRSHHASIETAETPSTMSSCSSRVSAKRASPNSKHDGVQYHDDVIITAKRPRLGDYGDQNVVESQGRATPSLVSSQETAVSDAERRSRAGTMISDTHDVGLAGRFNRTAISSSPSMYSGRIYSPESSSVNGAWPSMYDYDEISGQNPCNDDAVSEQNVEQASPPVDDYNSLHRHQAKQLARNTQKPNIQGVLQCVPKPSAIKTRASPIQYKSKKSELIYTAAADAISTANFFANQKDLDVHSEFWYQCYNGDDRGWRSASDPDQLQSAIDNHRLKEVIVTSNSLASTDHRVPTV